ncbi:class E sortase [Streptacidiphilus melanogenes]|uniref:class E sortase n=1 Tax=Streptacidiphilus melanogenes TaxID=411235 RepID=UPI00069392C7
MTALRPEPGAQPEPEPEPDWGSFFEEESDETLRLRVLPAPPSSVAPAAAVTPVTGGRAARRRGSAAAPPPAASESAGGGRAARRRAAKARQEGPGIIAVRVFGELLITLGAVMILFVAYQLWWTNVRADAYAQGQASTLEHQWGGGATARSHPPYPNSIAFGTKFAIIYIPKLDVKTPVAEGTDKTSILDNGLVGHYTGAQETAFPWDASGNFALAGHRNTHGEPFRYIPRLVPGDKIVVETAYDWYTYVVTSSLPQTSPNDVSVIAPVPPQSGFKGPGRYITLTTCTPEFTSTYRMAVWGRLVEDLPKSAGRTPAALSTG